MIPTLPYEDFSAATDTVLSFLRQNAGVEFWMATRIDGNDLIVLQTVGEGFPIKNGDVLSWADSLCWRMANGVGPRVAHDVSAVPMLATAPFTELLHVAAYIGAPLTLSDGKTYGTLCGLDRAAKGKELDEQRGLVTLMAGLLGAIVSREKSMGASAADAPDNGGAEVLMDPLTQLLNRRAWDRLLLSEESRCARHNHSACVIAVDINGLDDINQQHGRDFGDALLCKAAQIIKRGCRGYDIVARTGEDEFGVLAVECGLKGAKGIFDRVKAGLQREEVPAALGLSLRNAATGLSRTFEEATNTLVNAKRLSR